MNKISSIRYRQGKALLSFLLVFSFLVSILPPVPASAEGTATLSVGNAAANAGETVTVDVSIANCPNFYSMKLYISYDVTAMTLTSISRGEATTAGDFTGTPKSALGDYGVVLLDAVNVPGYSIASGDGVLFTLTFAVKSTAPSGIHNITITNQEFYQVDVNGENPVALEMSINNGTIDVVANQVASYNGVSYETVNAAIAAVVASGVPGTITMLKDITIVNYGERIVVPNGADITLDMNGHTIASEVPYSNLNYSCAVEVQAGGKLNLVDNSSAKGGKFLRELNVDNSRFLVNSGTLNMSDVDVSGFYYGIHDGSWFSLEGAAPGEYGAISNCSFQTVMFAMVLEAGNVNTITGCTIKTEAGDAIAIGDSAGAGKIFLLDNCTIESASEQVLSVYGTIETIRDCTIASTNAIDRKAIHINGGTIGKITSSSAGKHTEINGYINNYGTINLIESDYTLVNEGIYNKFGGHILEIAGGTFRSAEYSALENRDTIDSISGGVFIGGTSGYAIYSQQTGASIGSVTGGYYKTNSGYDLFYAVDGSSINIPAGYGLSSVPSTINAEDGFYRLGQIVNITWDIESVTEIDTLIVGDPVAYSGPTPTKTGEGYTYVFAGWSDGVTLYSPAQTLPAATQDTTYRAVFNELGPEEDYTVSLAAAAENVNAGDVFTVDVNITSNENNSFYGATIEVTFDNSIVSFDPAGSSYPAGFGITSTISGSTTTLRIVGAAQSGYAMTNHAYTVAALAFTVNSDIATGTATFGINDNPIVDQQQAVGSQAVTKGDDISINLWNLTVTFQAGGNVSMETKTAYVKYNEAGLYTDTTYGTAFTEPVPAAASGYTLSDPVWFPGSGNNVDYLAISGAAFTANAVYTATAIPSSFIITLPEGVTVISGIIEGQATYLTDIVFSVADVPGYVNVVSYSVGAGDPIPLTAVAGSYTIPGEQILGSIAVNVTRVVDGAVTFIANDEFRSLPAGYKLLVLTVSDKLPAGAYEYDGKAMFYSSKYSTAGNQVYLYVVPDAVTAEMALTKLQINTLSICIELAYNGDTNLDGVINSTDAVLTYGLYGGIWADDVFAKVSMQMRLEADVNGDKTVDTTDAQDILNKIWGL